MSCTCLYKYILLYFTQDSLGDAPLTVACGEGHADVATFLMDKGAVVNFQNKVTTVTIESLVKYSHVNCRMGLQLFMLYVVKVNLT